MPARCSVNSGQASLALFTALGLGLAVVTVGGLTSPRDAVGPLAEVGPAPAYSRAAFGDWVDADQDCQSTRNEVLIRDMVTYTLDPSGCVVERGVLIDPYTGERVDFVRGTRTSAEVQIDHVLPARAAWDGGAHAWTAAQRRDFFNDLQNLVATKGTVNSSKGARLPSTWVASTRGGACEYVQTVVQTAADWRIDLPETEDIWIDGFFDGDCPSPLATLTAG